MKFTLRFSEAKHGDEPVPGIVHLNQLMDCFVCGEQTHFADLRLGVGMCSETCATKLPRPEMPVEAGPDMERCAAAA